MLINRAVETFIRNKYERKQYASKDGLPKVSESREIKPEAKVLWG